MINTFRQDQSPAGSHDASTARRPPRSVARTLIGLGATGPVIFLALATVAGLLTPGYDPVTRPMSEIALGPRGWIMTANFFLCGLTTIGFAVGFFRSLSRPSYVGAALLGLAGIGLFASGIFPADLPGGMATATGAIHNNLFLLVFLALVIAYPCHALALRREQDWRGYPLYTALTAPVVIALLILFVGFGSSPGDPLYAIGGLIQRALLAIAFGWMTVVGRRLLAW